MSMPEGLKLTIVYEPAEEGGYAVWIQEVPGANSQGETREQARENVLDALRELVLAHRDLGISPPSGSR